MTRFGRNLKYYFKFGLLMMPFLILFLFFFRTGYNTESVEVLLLNLESTIGSLPFVWNFFSWLLDSFNSIGLDSMFIVLLFAYSVYYIWVELIWFFLNVITFVIDFANNLILGWYNKVNE